MTPRAGDILHVTREASVQFATPIFFRVIRVHDWPTYHGWLWLDGYQLDDAGDAVERRSIFVQSSGLRAVQQNTPASRRVAPQRHAPRTAACTSLHDRSATGHRDRPAVRRKAIATG